MSATPTALLPPGPRLPKTIQTLLFVIDARRFIESAWRKHGDVVRFSTNFDSDFVMVFHPRDVKAIFTAPSDVLHAGEANALLGPVLGESSVLLLDGSQHLHHRRLMLPPFHGRRLGAYRTQVRRATDRAIEDWPVGEPFALLRSMQSLTLDVIAAAVFGIEEGERAADLKRRLRDMLTPLGTRFGVLALALTGGRLRNRGAVARFAEHRARVDEVMYEEITARRGVEDLDEREDVFSMLLAARDEDGEGLTDAELRDQLITLLVAGHETTAAGLAWTFELLLRNPAVLQRLEASLADGEDDYLDAVVRESLRLRPVIAGVGRKVQRPFDLAGYRLPEGMELNPSIAGVHRRADVYPDPTAFRPERFLDAEGGGPDTYSWIPFGGGIRRCLGASFAMFEMREVVRRVLERCDLQAVGTRKERVMRRGITQVPEKGGLVRQLRPPRPVAATTDGEVPAAVTGTLTS